MRRSLDSFKGDCSPLRIGYPARVPFVVPLGEIAREGGKPSQKGHTKGGLNSKLHAVCDGEGKPLILLLSECQMSDHRGARLIFNALLPAKALLADRGYGSSWFRAALGKKGCEPYIPSTKSRKIPLPVCQSSIQLPKIQLSKSRPFGSKTSRRIRCSPFTASLSSILDSAHIGSMVKPPSSRKSPRGKAARPELHPLDEHLAALLNPALTERQPSVSEAPQASFDLALSVPPYHVRGRSGAAATVESLKELLEQGDPNIRNKKPWAPHRPPRPDKTEGGHKFRLVAEYEPRGDQPSAIEELVKGVTAQDRDQVLLGVTGSGKTYTMAQVIARTNRPALIMAPNKTLAAQLYGEFKSFFPDNAVEYFVSYYDYYQPEAYVPRTDTYIEKESSINEQIDRMRHAATRALLERDDVIIVASVSCIYGIGSVETYTAMTFTLTLGERTDQRQAVKDLAELQYKRTAGDFVRGTFRVRGDTIELFPAHYEDRAWRIGFFGDTIETLAEFDPLTGKKTQDLQFIKIYANSHYVTPRPTLLQSIRGIKQELKQRLAELNDAGRLIEAQRLEQRTMFDLEMLEATGSCAGIENYSRYLTGRKPGEPPPTLFEYLPDNALVFTDESHITVPQIGGMYRGDFRRKATLAEYGFRLPSCMDNRPLRFEEWDAMRPQTVYVSATPGPWELERSGGVFVEQVIRPTGLIDPPVEIRPARSQVDDLLGEVRDMAAKGYRTLATVLTKRMAEDLTEYLHDHGVRVRYMHSDIDTLERIEIIRDLRIGAFDVLVGINLLREGLDIPECGLVAILDADKEGFLRSETSLIQTIGRAARNVDSKVILYADHETGSMARAIAETNRRREKQKAYNEAQGITPASIKRGIADILGSVYERDHVVIDRGLSEREAVYAQDFKASIVVLEKRMHEAAANLEFEEAARYRDEIKRLQALELALGDDPVSRQSDLEAGALAGGRKYGNTALPVSRPHKPGDTEMGPHNFGGGEAKPRGGRAKGGPRRWKPNGR